MKILDMSVRGVRQLMRFYKRPTESAEDFLRDGYKVARLYLEEAFRRSVAKTTDSLRRRSLSTLMVTMRRLEEQMLTTHQIQFGVLHEFTEGNVRRILSAVQASEHTSIDILPSDEAVIATDMGVEAFSLMRTHSNEDDFLRMTDEEVRHLIVDNGMQLEQNEDVPGIQGQSIFADIYGGENPEVTETDDAENVGP